MYSVRAAPPSVIYLFPPTLLLPFAYYLIKLKILQTVKCLLWPGTEILQIQGELSPLKRFAFLWCFAFAYLQLESSYSAFSVFLDFVYILLLILFLVLVLGSGCCHLFL